jgi:hypothetical protein
VTLEDGRELSISIADYEVVTGSGLPMPSDLLLTGSAPRPWLAGLSTAAAPVPDCYWLGGGGIDAGEFIESDRGLRLPKATAFDSGTWQPDEGRFRANGFCVNERGEVASVH